MNARQICTLLLRRRFPWPVGAISALCAGLLVNAPARAEAGAPRIAIGVAPHLLFGLTESCSHDDDVVDCTPSSAWGGGDLGVWIAVLPALALGARVAASKNLDRTRAASSDGPSYDPSDQTLWRSVAELRLAPLSMARGLWLSLAGGWTRLHERMASLGPANSVISDEKRSDAALVGVGLGYDVWLGDSFKLAPELRGDVIFFQDSRPGGEGHEYGTSFWLEPSLRVAYVF